MNIEEEQLIAACKRRDPKACQQLYERFSAPMMGLCLRYMGSRTAAEDVLHDGFIKVFESLPKAGEIQSLSAWIYRVVCNTALSELRRLSRHQHIDLSEAEEVAAPDDNIGAFSAEEIVNAIGQLPELQRAIFNLSQIEGLHDHEIGAQFGLQPSSVRSIVCRSRKRIIQILNSL